jgi:hypothetical protein
VASLVKPVLDGLISALHIHNGTHRDALLPRLAQLGDPEQVWAQLLDPTVAVLGSRVLLRPHGQTGMAWNPADDLCTAFRVRRVPARDAALMATVRAAP